MTQTGIAPPALLSLLLVDGRSWHFSDSIIHEPIPHSKGKEKRARVRIRERERGRREREREEESVVSVSLGKSDEYIHFAKSNFHFTLYLT